MNGFVALLCLAIPASHAASDRPSFKFSFSPDKPAPGYVQVQPDTVFPGKDGFGFDLGSKVAAIQRGGDDALRAGFCTSERPFFFSVQVPEGNYNVTVTLGDSSDATTNTIKAESRRLMLENVVTAPGKFESRTFTVNVRRPDIAGGGRVGLKKRESGPPMVLHWDDKLTLEFNGARPGLCALEITPTEAITVFLAGDSTVTDQPNEPWNSWGQMLPRFFKSGVAVANHAESGESLKSFLGARRLNKILGEMKPGDYLFIQMGHNDQKDKAPGASAFTSYKTNLMFFVEEARKKGGLPVLVTSMERKAGVNMDTLGDFPEAVRRVAAEQKVPLIDLNAMSKVLYPALGGSLNKAFQDGTHHNNFGSYELARCVVEGIRANKLGIAKYLADDVPVFDPAHPDSPESLVLPPSPQKDTQKPDGN